MRRARRSAAIGWRLLAPVLWLTGALAPASLPAETRALLLGVSHYGSDLIPDLGGPANDLAAMERMARSAGATDVVTLRDAAISRSSVETALQSMGARARPGDWILLYFSGHGAQALAQVATAKDGSFDQFVPLPGFDPEHQDPERFIVDKDFYAWLKRYVPTDVRVLMLVDSCHSGTMHRAVDQRAFGFTARLAFRGEDRAFRLVGRPGPRLPPLQGLAGAASGTEREDLPNLVYIGASRDDQLALEFELPQEGAPSHGVLTFALETGLSIHGSSDAGPAADLDGDGKVSVLELSSYLNSQVRMLTAQRQESTAFFPSAWSDLPVLSALPAPGPAPAGLPVAVAFADAAGAPPEPTPDATWRPVASTSAADFVWSMRSGEVLRRSGDLVATGVNSVTALAGVIEKWRTVQALQPLVSELNMRMLVAPDGSDFLYKAGSHVSLSLRRTERSPGGGRRYATVFDLASDGTVQLLYPLTADGAGLLPPSGAIPILETEVVPPYGTDHVVALTTVDPPEELRAALRTANGQRAPGRLTGAILATMKQAKGTGALSIVELYTGR